MHGCRANYFFRLSSKPSEVFGIVIVLRCANFFARQYLRQFSASSRFEDLEASGAQRPMAAWLTLLAHGLVLGEWEHLQPLTGSCRTDIPP